MWPDLIFDILLSVFARFLDIIFLYNYIVKLKFLEIIIDNLAGLYE